MRQLHAGNFLALHVVGRPPLEQGFQDQRVCGPGPVGGFATRGVMMFHGCHQVGATRWRFTSPYRARDEMCGPRTPRGGSGEISPVEALAGAGC